MANESNFLLGWYVVNLAVQQIDEGVGLDAYVVEIFALQWYIKEIRPLELTCD